MSSNADRLVECFNQAKALPAGAEREEFLAAACGFDAELRGQVDKLLRSHESAGNFLKVGAGVSPELEAEFARLKPEEAGERIGHYKLLEQIGQGGFGTVWVAEQERPVRRRVALKIIKMGMDTREVIARFEQERQALAMMDHPNIAKVFDAGATATGRPYFVMELVRGIKITEYCDQENLSTAERLALFIAVCHAVQHAHQKGIIHRDLKPSNILVTLHDGVPVPKVIDFGVAKATQQQRLTDLTVYTQFEQMVGTPLYMSPEQAEMSGLDIDTRSDIYSLGVLLYELLTGRTPFDPEELMRQGLDEIRRTIREQEPQTPSTFVQTMALDLRTSIARHRQADGAKLAGLIRGDLDWIVMKAIEKDRARRYETASALGLDIKRHLDSEPVLARRATALYRFRRMVRRNKLAVAASTAVAIALVLGVMVSTWQAIRATRAEREQSRLRETAQRVQANEVRMRQKAEAGEKKAQSEATKSEQVAQFLQGMLKGVGPSVAAGRDTTMLREILDKTAARLSELESQPAVEADLRATLGKVYSDLGEYAAAAAMHKEALGLRRKLFGNEHPQVAASMHDLANALADRGGRLEGEAMHRDALAMRIKLFGHSHVDVAESFSSLAMALRHQGKTAEAESTARKALEICVQVFGQEHAAVANALHILAFNLSKLGRDAEAEEFSKKELAIWRKLLGNDHPNVGGALTDLTFFLRAQGKLQEAETTAREGLEIGRKQSLDDPAVSAAFLRQLGFLLQSQARPAEAEGAWRDELAVRRKTVGNDHPELAATLYNLAGGLQAEGKFPEAETAIREALAIQQKRMGKEHPDTANSLRLLSGVLRAQGKLTEMEIVLREDLAARRNEFGKDSAPVATSLSAIGSALHEQGKLDEAEVCYREALAIKRAHFGEVHREVDTTLGELAYVLEKNGRLAEAEALRREELAMERKLSGDDHPFVPNSLMWLGTVLHRQGKQAEAEDMFRETLAMRRKLLGNDHPDVAASLSWLSATLSDQHKNAEAEETSREALAIRRKHFGNEHVLVAQSLAELSDTLLAAQKFAEAEPPARECLSIRENKLPGDWRTFNARSMLGGSLLGQKKYAEAEPLLLSGYEGIKEQEHKIPAEVKPRVKEALQRLVQLYEATRRSDRAAEWRVKIVEWEKAAGVDAASVRKP